MIRNLNAGRESRRRGKARRRRRNLLLLQLGLMTRSLSPESIKTLMTSLIWRLISPEILYRAMVLN